MRLFSCVLSVSAAIAACALIFRPEAAAQGRSTPVVIRTDNNPYAAQYAGPFGGVRPVLPTYYSGVMVADGASTDTTWFRGASGRAVDSDYVPAMPEIPYDLLPPRMEERSMDDPTRAPKFGERVVMYDPYKDDTRRIFHYNSERFGDGAYPENASFRPEVIAIELFGVANGCPLDMVDAVRAETARGAASRTCHYVLDAQAEIGGRYDNSSVCIGGRYEGFHNTPRMELLYTRGVRYVISGALLHYSTHRYKSSPESKSYTCEALLTLVLSAYDLDLGRHIRTKIVNIAETGSSPSYVDRSVLDQVRSEARSFTSENFKIATTIQALGEPDKKGKIKTCIIASGADMCLQKTDLFEVYPAENPGGSSLGRVKVMSVSSSTADCNITKGANNFVPLYQDGVDLILISNGQALF